MGYKIKYKNRAGKRGYGRGDGDGGGEATPPTPPAQLPLSPARLPLSPARLPLSPARTPPSPSSDPRALATSPVPLQPPRARPRTADQDTDGGHDGGDSREEETDEFEDNKEPLLDLVEEHSNGVIQQKIEILSQRYAHFRRTHEDSNCFYRAFLFSYLENLGQLQDRQAEVTRLMEHVDTSKESFCGLTWDEAYLSNHEGYFSSVMAELNQLVNSVANGLSSDDLFKCCSQAIRSPRIIPLLRLLAETEIRTGGDEYQVLRPENFDALSYCCNKVRPMDSETQVLAIRALTYALGIPLRVEAVDGGLTEGTPKVRRFDFFPRSEPGKSSYHAFPSLWSSVTPPTPQEMGSGNLISSDRTPLLTLMCMRNPKRWYILYRG